MSVKDLPLYRRQLQILRAPGKEILALGEGGGKSHALRAGMVLTASTDALAPCTCVLAHPNDDELRREHVEGPTGFKALLAEASQEGAVEIRPDINEARFKNGSRLMWVALNRQPEVRRLTAVDTINLGCVDEAHRVALDQFELMVGKTIHAVPHGRIVAAAPRMAGWLSERWGNGSGHRKVIETSRGDLPKELHVIAAQPTIEQFLDGLGVPFLMPDSAFRQARHVRKVLDVLQRWFFGEFQNLLLLMPTQLGKTMLGVRTMAAYLEYCRPYETVGLTSFATDKALNRSRDARDFYLKAGGRLIEGASGRDYWQTPYGGGVWAAGFAAGQSGNPMTWGLVDDPDADMKQARSPPAIRDKDEWYQYVWLGREAKFAARPLSQLWAATRFWRGDTVGRTLDFHAKRGDPWHILVLPALYDPEVISYYENLAPGLFTVEPDFRTDPGEPIFPEGGYDRERWEKNRKSNLRVFLSRDQQKPEESEGGTTFDETWPIDLAVDPGFAAGVSLADFYLVMVRAWDLAATAGAGDWTACVSMAETRDSSRYVVRHAARARLATRAVMRMIAGTMLLDGPDVDIILPEDPAAAGKHQTGRIVDYLNQVVRRVSIPCSDCLERGRPRSRCKDCAARRFRRPLIRTVSTREGIVERFESFADRATPISDQVEGYVDFVAAPWTPAIDDSLPWFGRAVEVEEDRDWQEELRQIRRLMKRLTSGEDPDLTWIEWQTPYFRELHLHPDVDHDDWVAATAHAWGTLSAPRSVYPKG